jgi:muramoyltetrapeptide carboxypeptidase
LRPGDTIGIVAPAAATDALAVEAGVCFLEDAGYRVRLGSATLARTGYLAGKDEQRRRDLVDMFEDDEVRAILATRGGYGSGRLLPVLDPAIAARHPKIFVGYSDLTFLLTHFMQRGELVTFHGPMLVDLERQRDAATALLRALAGDRSGWNLAAATIVQPGTAEGRITGGCLSVVVATLGTPYEIATEGKILFLEDVNEKPFRVDRMLTQLRQAGKLSDVAAVMFGEMPGCTADPYEAVTVVDVIREKFAADTFPVVVGIPSGHGGGNATLPLGVRAQLAGQRLTLLESPLAD